jgi:hypothetical protein
MLLETQTKAISNRAELERRFLDDTGSVIEEMGWKGLMIGAALAAGVVVAAVVAAWAGAIPTP